MHCVPLYFLTMREGKVKRGKGHPKEEALRVSELAWLPHMGAHSTPNTCSQ